MEKVKSKKSRVEIKDGYFKGRESLDIYFREYIVEDSKGSIVLSHGFCESLEKYKELIKVFNQNEFSVYSIDHRGHGCSSRLGIGNSQVNVEKFEYYVDDFKTFLDEIVIPNKKDNKTFLFAHSMGGAIGALFLEKYSNYFDCAILSCPMMEVNTGKYPALFSKLMAKGACMFGQGERYILNHEPFKGKEDLKGSGTSSHKRYSTYFNKQLKNKCLQTSGGSFNWLNESFKATKYIVNKNNAEKVVLPILLFQAGKDSFVGSKGQNKFASYAKDCKINFIKEAKHEIYMERDEIFNPYIEKVLEFYNSKL